MSDRVCTAAAHPNLALVKYWGQTDSALMLPANTSISLNLSGATTVTRVAFYSNLKADRVFINDAPADGPASLRVRSHLDRVRALAGISQCAEVSSHNDFPAAAGIASSASAFAALSLAATRAVGLDLDVRSLSMLARRGSGSACRSIPDGFVEWQAGQSDETSYARSIAACDHWDLRVITLYFGEKTKSLSSLGGHAAAPSSPYYAARLGALPATLERVRRALADRDFHTLGMEVEREAIAFHSIAMTSLVTDQVWLSGIYYWSPETLAVIQAVQMWRAGGLPVYFTLDAGPSVHLFCEAQQLDRILNTAAPIIDSTGAGTIISRPGRGAWIPDEERSSDASCRL